MARLKVTEVMFQQQVIDYAQSVGWRCAHFRPARMKGKDGEEVWRTPVQADGKGWPDLVMVRAGRQVVMELKSDKGELSPDQQAWLEAFGQCRDVEVYLCKPGDIAEIEEVLR